MVDRKKYNVVFMGTPDFARASLEALVDAGYNVNLIVTNVDTKSGRGMNLKFSPVKEYGVSKNIEVYQPEKLRKNEEALQKIKDAAPDFIVTAAYGKILPKEILDIPKIAPINVHGSLLPKYRGSAPVQWAIINGEEKTGITTMIMDVGMDTGDMLLKEETPISHDDDLEKVFDRLTKIGAKLIVKTLDSIIENKIERVKQNDEEASFAPMISKEMMKIDFSKSAKDITNFVRGLYSSYIEDEMGNRYKVYKVKEGDASLRNISDEKGKLAYITKNRLAVNCEDGSIVEVLIIQPPNSKKMDIAAFLAGNKMDKDVKFV